ncbi:hypothetical protein WJX72_003482 [[Myrmecia] bisecta]|uniref:BHLH domain-containing protein n=1 Tax=[Myrmecia] bisecta TaxID=41462 RepID=A0AAW1PS22_9CHLO
MDPNPPLSGSVRSPESNLAAATVKRPRVEAAAGLALMHTAGQSTPLGIAPVLPPQPQPAPAPAPPTKTVLSHVATEQRRRDRINEGFAALRELIPHKDKMDKASFLQQAVEYIQQLQTVIRQLLDMGAVGSLPEESQWAIRLLVPRKAVEAATAPASTSAAPALASHAAGGITGLSPSSAYLPYLLQPQQLALLTKHTQQAIEQNKAGGEAAPAAAPAPALSLNLVPQPGQPQQQNSVNLAGNIDLCQLQALLQQQQQQQAAHQMQAQQATRGLWQDPNTLWQMAQLQQLVQSAQSQALNTTGLSLPNINQDTLNSLAQQQQALSMFMSQAPSSMPVPHPSLPAPAPPTTCTPQAPTPSEAASRAAAEKGQQAKARKSVKVRRGGTAAKIEKPELPSGGATPAPGRPELSTI